MDWPPLDVHWSVVGALSSSRREKCNSLQKWILLVGESGKGTLRLQSENGFIVINDLE
jgi:hypothetical protein